MLVETYGKVNLLCSGELKSPAPFKRKLLLLFFPDEYLQNIFLIDYSEIIL